MHFQKTDCTKKLFHFTKNNNAEKEEDKKRNWNFAEEVKSDNNISNDSINLSGIYRQLLEAESKKTSEIKTSPRVCTNSAHSPNSTDSIVEEDNSDF